MINLSYILTTYNKSSFLKITLPDLIKSCKDDEEIIIVDGGSTDGTQIFLEELFAQNKIHQYSSSKDFGESHGTNKALLMAKGELIKIITDDDFFDYSTIQECKNYMLSNKQVDILGSDGIGVNTHIKDINITKNIKNFISWKSTNAPFIFSGLSYMIRKSSLSLLGLFNTRFKIIDWEYSLRITGLPINMAWHTKFSFVNIITTQSNSQKYEEMVNLEKKKFFMFYIGSNIERQKMIIYTIRKSLSQLKNIFIKKEIKEISSYLELYFKSAEIISIENNKIESKFLTNI